MRCLTVQNCSRCPAGDALSRLLAARFIPSSARLRRVMQKITPAG